MTTTDAQDVTAPETAAPAGVCPEHPDRPVAAACARCGKFLCVGCARPAKPGLVCAPCDALLAEPPRIGGWLYLVRIGLYFQVIGFGLTALSVGGEVLAHPVDDVLADVPWLAANAWNLAGSAAIAALAIYILPKFNARLRSVPRLMQFLYGLGISLNALDWIASSLLDPERFAPSSPVGGFVAPMVWFAYFTFSRRVKETFVGREAPSPGGESEPR